MKNDTTGHEHEEFIARRIKRALAFKALRNMRGMVDAIEREEQADKKRLKVLCTILPALIILLLIFLAVCINRPLP